MTQSFAGDEVHARAREMQNVRAMINDARNAGKLTGEVYHQLVALADSEVSPYVVYGTLAYFQVQEPVGSRHHHWRRVDTIVGYQSGRVHR